MKDVDQQTETEKSKHIISKQEFDRKLQCWDKFLNQGHVH